MNKSVKSHTLALLIATGAALASASSGVTAAEPNIIDLETERAIQKVLLTDSELAQSQIFVSCEDGVVSLYGSAESSLVKARAQSLVEKIEGVTEVNNYITAG